MISQREEIETELKKFNYLIDFELVRRSSGLQIKIANQGILTQIEKERMISRVRIGEECDDFLEAFNQVHDETEGAGLGIILIMILLKSMGLSANAFKVHLSDKQTEVEVFIPFEIRSPTMVHKIKERILEEISDLPSFPQNVQQLLQLCRNPETSISIIAHHIMKDPALSADVLKLANSACFAANKKSDNIQEAVVRMGFKNLEALLLTAGAKRILFDRYKTGEKIWSHTKSVSVWARIIAEHKKQNRLLENAALAGLLHDLGKIILMSLNQSITEKINFFIKQKQVSVDLLEEIMLGISHSVIGSLIAQKWNFPDYLVKTIQYHHSPFQAPIENQMLVKIVYLANLFSNAGESLPEWIHYDIELLHEFGLEDLQVQKNLHDNYEAFQEQSSN